MTKFHTVQGFDPLSLFGAGFTLGSADLIQGGYFWEAIGKSIVTLLSCLQDKDGRPPIKRVVIILPPADVTEHTNESVFIALARAVRELRGTEFSEREVQIIHQIVRVVHSSSLEVTELMRTIQQQGQGKQLAIAVADASKYRDNSLNLPANLGISAVRLAEDRWVPHVVSICKHLVSIVKTQEGYGLIHVSDVPAQKPANEEQLQSVDDCYVACLSFEADPEEEFNSRAQIWRSMVLQDRLSEVKAEIGDLSLPESVKIHALIQLLRGTGHDCEMLGLIAQLQHHLPDLKREASIQVAQLAYQAGDDELSLAFLPLTPEGLGDQLWLEEGLELAFQLEDNNRIELFDARLEALFPHSARLQENRVRRLLVNCQNARFGEPTMISTAGFTDFQLNLQKCLSVENPKYDAIIALSSEERDLQELAAICCALHALNADNPMYAAEVVSNITVSELYGRQATQILLRSIKAMMLKELPPEGENDNYRLLFRDVFKFIAHHPEDHDIRLRLQTLLSVESCGDIGVPIVALTMMDLAQEGVVLAQQSTDSTQYPSSEQNRDIEVTIKNGFDWIRNVRAVEPGVTVLPSQLLVAEPDLVVSKLEHLVDMASGVHGTEIDLEFMNKLVLLACAITPHATQKRNSDIPLLRHLANNLAIQGQYQKARNLAETILLIGSQDDYRCRLAWGSYGDVYHRCHNHTIALLGLANAQAINVEIDKADLWEEIYSIHRVMRDIGILTISRAFLSKMQELLHYFSENTDKKLCMLGADLALRLIEINDTDLEGIRVLVQESAKACKDAIENGNKVYSFALLLGQAVLRADKADVEVSSEIRSLWGAISKSVGGNISDTVKTMSVEKPSSRDVLAMFDGLEQAIYSSDVAHDYSVLEVAARRLLDTSPQSEQSCNDNIFATELLADHTVVLLDDRHKMTLEWPFQYATELNQSGLDVAFLALDTRGELAVTYVSNKQVCTIEQPRSTLSFRHRLQVWLQDYPKSYGHIDSNDGNNIFYTTMEQLNVLLPPSERLILVAEPFLQQLTANLILAKTEGCEFSDFAGKRTAIGIIPSLSWLSSARVTKQNSPSVYKAWISAETNSAFSERNDLEGEKGVDQFQSEHQPTLDLTLNRLSGCFEEFGFIVDTGRKIPLNMKDAELAVITAHGGLNRDGRYLHRISDDRDLVASPSALATALSGVGLVILFVCSGGRIDKNPWSNSTTSLPKQLLNNGCRAVIASPWPLNVMVTYNWLGVFMRKWEEGETVLDATKMANDAVARQLGDFPQYSMAMCVYGDVLYVKPKVG